ncbi:MAG: DEAD/DEAH box helicase [Pseudomonadota bacterium]
MFTIQSHGIKNERETFSYAQNQLIESQSPIRICGSPTGSGKTYAFLEMAKTELVFFVVPTQALAKDIKKTAIEKVKLPRVEIWDFTTTLAWIKEGKEPWRVRKGHLEDMAHKGSGIIIATLEALGNLVLGKPGLKNVDTGVVDLLWKVKHLVFDEAHTLNERAFGLVHFMITLIADLHQKNPEDAPKLSLLSATHSNLFTDFMKAGDLPDGFIDSFDEQIENADYDRPIHGDVEVAFHDKPLLEMLEELAPTLVPQLKDKSLLLIYDSLAKFVADENTLAHIFDSCGLARNQIILINGQDKQTPYSWGSSGFDGGRAPLPRHKIIIGTSAVEMGVNFKVNQAIIEHGIDAAALLQRIGRVARGADCGKVEVCRSSLSKRKKLSFIQTLSKLSGNYTITALRQEPALNPLRKINTQRARELGKAYWSMLSRQHPNLIYGAAKPAVESLSSQNKSVVGLLSFLHGICSKRHFKKWLTQVDRTLQDVRGFSPTVRVRFKDNQAESCEGEYNRDWVLSKLVSPDAYDSENDVYIYNQSRDNYLRDKPIPIYYAIYSPFGGIVTVEASNIDEAWKKYLNRLEDKRRRHGREPGFEEALKFIQITGLLARDDEMDSPELCDMI